MYFLRYGGLIMSKYTAQANHIRKNYVRFNLDLKPDMLESFRTICKDNNTTPTTEIKKFISKYIEEHQ